MIPGPPPETTENPASESSAGRLLGKRIVRMASRNARAAEHAHCRTDLVHSLGGLDEFLTIMRNRRQASPAAFASREALVERFRNLVAHKFPWKNAAAG